MPKLAIGRSTGQTGKWVKLGWPVIFFPVALMVAMHVYNNQLLLLDLVVYLILAQGVNIIYGFTGYLPFGYFGFFGAGAYGAALAVNYLSVDGILAVVAGGILAVVLAVILIPLLRLSGAYFGLASLAAAESVYLVVANPSLASITKGPYGVNLEAIFNPNLAYLVGVILVGISIAVVVYLRVSHFGLSLRAIKSDPVTASLAGVNVPAARSIAWLLAAALAGLAGGVFAWITSVFYPETVFSINVSVFAIVFALFGGVGSVLGPILGGTALYILYEFIGISSPQYFQLIYGGLIVFLTLFLPGGLASLVEIFRRRVPRSRAEMDISQGSGIHAPLAVGGRSADSSDE